MRFNDTTWNSLVNWSAIKMMYWKPHWLLDSGPRMSIDKNSCGLNTENNFRGVAPLRQEIQILHDARNHRQRRRHQQSFEGNSRFAVACIFVTPGYSGSLWWSAIIHGLFRRQCGMTFCSCPGIEWCWRRKCPSTPL